MKRGILSDSFPCKPEMAFFKVILLFQMTYLWDFMNEIKYENFKMGCITCKVNIKATEKNVTNNFRINFCYVFVHAKTTLSMECQKM